MNVRLFTGYLIKDAARAYSPGPDSRCRLQFDVMVKDAAGNEFPEKCCIQEEAIIAANERFLTAGRAVIVDGECTAKPFIKQGYQAGWTREVIVRHIEIPNRSIKQEAATAAA